MDLNCSSDATTLAQATRQQQLQLQRGARDMGREQQKLQREETKVAAEMKQLANAGQMDSVRILAKQLVATRKTKHQLQLVQTQQTALCLRLVTANSVAQSTKAISQVQPILKAMNDQLDATASTLAMQEFMKQSAALNERQRLVDDALDFALGDDEDEDDMEVENEVQKIMDSVVLDVQSVRPGASRLRGMASSAQEDRLSDGVPGDVTARYNALRGARTM